jgi:site-specific recombinase XerC
LGLGLDDLGPSRPGSSSRRAHAAPTVKLRLAALRHLFDWLVTGQVMPTNPAGSVRGPSHIVKSGKTPVLAPEDAFIKAVLFGDACAP